MCGEHIEYARFSGALGAFADPDSLRGIGLVDPKCWWVLYGSLTPLSVGFKTFRPTMFFLLL